MPHHFTRTSPAKKALKKWSVHICKSSNPWKSGRLVVSVGYLYMQHGRGHGLEKAEPHEGWRSILSRMMWRLLNSTWREKLWGMVMIVWHWERTSLRRANGSNPMRNQNSMPVWSIEGESFWYLSANRVLPPISFGTPAWLQSPPLCLFIITILEDHCCSGQAASWAESAWGSRLTRTNRNEFYSDSALMAQFLVGVWHIILSQDSMKGWFEVYIAMKIAMGPSGWPGKKVIKRSWYPTRPNNRDLKAAYSTLTSCSATSYNTKELFSTLFQYAFSQCYPIVPSLGRPVPPRGCRKAYERWRWRKF